MPKYLFIASLTSDGVKGVMATGGTSRQKAVSDACKDAGGTLDSFYFAFGGDDVYTTADLPDNEAAAALALNVAASGVVGVRTVVLLTPAEVDAAAKRKVNYRPPGS